MIVHLANVILREINNLPGRSEATLLHRYKRYAKSRQAVEFPGHTRSDLPLKGQFKASSLRKPLADIVGKVYVYDW
jgi:hypothetical protein